VSPETIVADGVLLQQHDNGVMHARYQLTCDRSWQLRSAGIAPLRAGQQPLVLQTDGAGHWTTPAGEALPDLAGCLDIDISATPFTNTLPIRRLSLQVGETRAIAVAYVALPELHVRPLRQRYTCLAMWPDGGLYRFEHLESGFTAELPVDADGLVLDYPGLFRRVWPAQILEKDT
jgi:uncharacterized protein